MAIDKLKNKFSTGAFVADVKHYFSKINEIIDYLNGNGKVGDGSYKEFIGLLSQSGTLDPTITVFKNTLNTTVSPSRNLAGVYYIDFNEAYTTIDKLFVPNFGNSSGGPGVFIPILQSNLVVGYYTLASNEGVGLILYVYDVAGSLTELSSIYDSTNQLPIEFKIFN